LECNLRDRKSQIRAIYRGEIGNRLQLKGSAFNDQGASRYVYHSKKGRGRKKDRKLSLLRIRREDFLRELPERGAESGNPEP